MSVEYAGIYPTHTHTNKHTHKHTHTQTHTQTDTHTHTHTHTGVDEKTHTHTHTHMCRRETILGNNLKTHNYVGYMPFGISAAPALFR